MSVLSTLREQLSEVQTELVALENASDDAPLSEDQLQAASSELGHMAQTLRIYRLLLSASAVSPDAGQPAGVVSFFGRFPALADELTREEWLGRQRQISAQFDARLKG